MHGNTIIIELGRRRGASWASNLGHIECGTRLPSFIGSSVHRFKRHWRDSNGCADRFTRRWGHVYCESPEFRRKGSWETTLSRIRKGSCTAQSRRKNRQVQTCFWDRWQTDDQVSFVSLSFIVFWRNFTKKIYYNVYLLSFRTRYGAYLRAWANGIYWNVGAAAAGENCEQWIIEQHEEKVSEKRSRYERKSLPLVLQALSIGIERSVPDKFR